MGRTYSNKIIEISEFDLMTCLDDIKQNYEAKIIEIDGKCVDSWEDYSRVIEKEFDFPTTCVENMDGYSDWIRDLSWIDADAYIIVIRNANSFLKNNIELKKTIFNHFTESIFPFWEYDVEKYVVDGKRKLFIVFLVK